MFNNLIYDLITGKRKRRSNYEYKGLEYTPYLQSSETLNTMYKNSVTKEQKASIMLHIDRFYEHTNDVDSYRKLKNKIWDDFRYD